jgi:TatA/E family protein of Tat protein translocase
MFGVGFQEMLLVGLLLLVLFGPSKLPQMARDFGRFVNEARRSVDEFKEELMSEEPDGRKPRQGRKPEVSGGLKEDIRREEVAVIARSAPPTE